MSHPPFAHNPHVYNGIDPDAETTSLVVTSRAHLIADEPADEAPTDVDGDGKLDGYEVFSKADLIGECEARGLPTSGNKPDLVARLQEADKAAQPPVENGE